MSGCLWVVATPIGNLEDISARAARVLASVQRVCAEDTRTSQRLLSHLGVRVPLTALHEHNEHEQVPKLVAAMLAGEQLALVSDAGTPLISDPGFRLVRAAREAGIRVSPVPGACAAIAALSVAGVASDRFCFEGFLPARSGPRKARLRELGAETRTLVLYESSHRILESLADLAEILGPQRRVVMGRELTKLFETVLDAPVSELLAQVTQDRDQQKGEFVLVVEGAEASRSRAQIEGERVFAILSRDLPPSQAARLAAEISGADRKALYRMAATERASDEAEDAPE